MPLLPLFDPPGNLDDFTDPDLRRAWSRRIGGFFKRQIDGLTAAGVTPQFYDPTKTETTDPVAEKVIAWTGFPKLVKDAHPGDDEAAWREAEPSDQDAGPRLDSQDEYLEWNVVRNGAGKITRVSFTCEGPEYWQFLAERAPQKLLELYRALVNPALRDQVQLGDLMPGGSYDPGNRWNTLHGAIHLIQSNNNLGAEVGIAAQSTVLREKNGQPVEDPDTLTRCGRLGQDGRNSDPRIAIDVQDLARAGFAITLKNPVGLYITRFDSSSWRKPDGSIVGNYWKILRGKDRPAPGKPAAVLHLVYEVPAAEGFVVGDIRIGNRTINFAGQIAEFIQVGLTGLACREGEIQNQPRACIGGQSPFGIAAADPAERKARMRAAAGRERLSRASLTLEE